jgi:anti-sigma B factor antagonist
MKELVISERRADDAIILDLSGDLIFGEANAALRSTMRRLLREGNTNITLNLEEVLYLDSSGIGELISALTAMNREENGRLKLLNPTERIQTLLQISKLMDVFEIEYDEGHAVGC